MAIKMNVELLGFDAGRQRLENEVLRLDQQRVAEVPYFDDAEQLAGYQMSIGYGTTTPRLERQFQLFQAIGMPQEYTETFLGLKHMNFKTGRID